MALILVETLSTISVCVIVTRHKLPSIRNNGTFAVLFRDTQKTAKGWTAEGSWFDFRWGKLFCSSVRISDRLCDAPSLSHSMCPRRTFPDPEAEWRTSGAIPPFPLYAEYLSCPLKCPQAYLDAAMWRRSAGNFLVSSQIKFLVSNEAEVSVPRHLLTVWLARHWVTRKLVTALYRWWQLSGWPELTTNISRQRVASGQSTDR